MEAVREVHRGRRYLDSRVARNIVLDRVSGRLSPLDALTPREIEVMTWIAKGSRVQEIATALARSPKTIRHAPKPGLPQARRPLGRGARAARDPAPPHQARLRLLSEGVDPGPGREARPAPRTTSGARAGLCGPCPCVCAGREAAGGADAGMATHQAGSALAAAVR